MTPEEVLTLGRDALSLGILIAAPLLLTALIVGVLIGVFQAATQINEMTLSFIPKLLGMAAAAVLAGPWILRMLSEYTVALVRGIPAMLH
ncbi:flagellar biosynthesis protein FliQ [Sinimarinibacterium sp. CAU 1509]|uniref:flagellar biosynthesis protein FliQ n=1 Tax=Sinimarinibacterium sp. CAU 1509 TaxID=2562283 RepID=UPI0010ACF36E|nr:flagellar biosynthesis protein FliQ [Sinimarinibacterium sp. CAU 1509]TJY62844.1 flagellar biosynthesis protein FliQ [Sinimarinibacterium sp. CAU 1509]